MHVLVAGPELGVQLQQLARRLGARRVIGDNPPGAGERKMLPDRAGVERAGVAGEGSAGLVSGAEWACTDIRRT